MAKDAQTALEPASSLTPQSVLNDVDELQPAAARIHQLGGTSGGQRVRVVAHGEHHGVVVGRQGDAESGLRVDQSVGREFAGHQPHGVGEVYEPVINQVMRDVRARFGGTDRGCLESGRVRPVRSAARHVQPPLPCGSIESNRGVEVHRR
jgi:hypothetical protein